MVSVSDYLWHWNDKLVLSRFLLHGLFLYWKSAQIYSGTTGKDSNLKKLKNYLIFNTNKLKSLP